MTDMELRATIGRSWLAKAHDTLAEAAILLRENKPVGCANRLYYAVFYAVSAVLACDGREYGRHSAVRAALHRDYVNTGRVPEWCGEVYDELFEDRQEGDYMPATSFTQEDLSAMWERARSFVDEFARIADPAGGHEGRS